jgi:integrase
VSDAYRFIAAEKANYPISLMSRLLGVSRQGFHAWERRALSQRSLIDAGVNPKAIQEFMGHATIEETFSRYGHLMPGMRNQARELVDAYMSAAAAEVRRRPERR